MGGGCHLPRLMYTCVAGAADAACVSGAVRLGVQDRAFEESRQATKWAQGAGALV